MARNKVLTLWTSIVTAFLALCTALGLVTTTAAAAVPQTGTHSNSESASPEAAPAAALPLPRSRTGSLPPTMKQRIRAEAHGAAPSCRHHPLADAAAASAATTAATTTTGLPCDDTAVESRAQHTIPLQR
ncbi:DUF6344 domain-containing protein [Streptomyces violaceoruber]|uniref:Secreted protein n=6 Tax=Streptomyces TaxID=1883 RepID=Q9XA01_STRCO|nr:MULTISPECIES: DUF6344 domain-containing protein [Streptomyces]QSJ10282.1 hypothetical protein SLIVDG2_18950 [Streptomyces lividans]AIJ14741.1 hypothetical protein SLIV_18950 [Streptomyces lividans TK24]EFD68152.1 secreted protein [Streptomyces lividans TK24]EOY48828.1 secreted protein [Streptomyces lividans 1326]KKD15449.1 hypothetical protein TR66_09910 [Streptomyces sp. WM6391]